MAQVLMRMVAVAMAYYAGAWLGVNKTITPEGIAIIWPANAIVLSAFLLFPVRQWPFIGLAVLAAELTADLPAFPFWAAVAFGLVNLAEAATAAWLIRRFVPGRFDFDRLYNGVCFLLFGPLFSAALAALLGAAIYVLLGRTDSSYMALWRLWWFGDALGLLLLTPLIVTLWQRLENGTRLQLPWRRCIEALVLWSLVVVLGLKVFLPDAPASLDFHFTPLLLVPLGMWSALRFGVAGTTVTVALIAVMAVGLLMQGVHPYPNVSPQRAVWLTQEYLAIVAIVSVGLALLLHELAQQRSTLYRHERKLRTQNEYLEQRIAERTSELEQANESLQTANKRLEQLATTDFLTQFSNRRNFEEMSQRELQRLKHTGTVASLIMFDLDHFKTVNDQYGHDTGDEVLRRIGKPVRDVIRPRDLCARIGGEEFAILLSEANQAQACEVAERIRVAIAAQVIEYQGVSVQITASIGVAEWNGRDSLAILMQQADMALYRAKNKNRNRVAV